MMVTSPLFPRIPALNGQIPCQPHRTEQNVEQDGGARRTFTKQTGLSSSNFYSPDTLDWYPQGLVKAPQLTIIEGGGPIAGLVWVPGSATRGRLPVGQVNENCNFVQFSENIAKLPLVVKGEFSQHLFQLSFIGQTWTSYFEKKTLIS
jgi:hypothetical protein